MPDNSGPSFPVPPEQNDPDGWGMSLRDYIAIRALQGILAGYWSNSDLGGLSPQSLGNEAYDYADAMIAARTK